jgi:hypothetical protein
MKKHCLCLLALLLGITAVAQRNVRNPRKPTLNFGVQVMQPIGQFAETFEGYPAGFAGQFHFPIARSPIEIGLGAAWNSMGAQNEQVLVGTGFVDLQGDEIVSEGRIRMGSNNYRYTSMLRFRPFAGLIQPYAELVAGVETYSTTTRISMNDPAYQATPGRDVHQRDVGVTTGWAAGLALELVDGISINGRFENLRGSEATYVDGNTLVLTNEQELRFETRTSATDKYTYTVGVTIRF